MEELPLKDCAKNWNIPIDEIKTELESSGLYPKRVTVATTIDEWTAGKLKALLDKKRGGGAQITAITQTRGKNRPRLSVGGVGLKERLLARKAQTVAKSVSATAPPAPTANVKKPSRLSKLLVLLHSCPKCKHNLLDCGLGPDGLLNLKVRCPKCKGRYTDEKWLYETKKFAEAEAEAKKAERKLFVYRCEYFEEWWHLTSRCNKPNCNCREIFYTEKQAKKRKLNMGSEGENYAISDCERCGYTILSRWR